MLTVLHAGFLVVQWTSGLSADEPRGAPPANNECSGAQLIQCNSTVNFDNTNATANISDPAFSCAFGGPARGEGTVWFRFVAGASSALVTTRNSTGTQDNRLAVYRTGSCPLPAANEIACSEDEGPGFLAQVCASGLTIGQTYYIQVASFSVFDLGPMTLELICPVPQTRCTLAGANCQTADNFSSYVSNRTDVLVADDFHPSAGGNITQACFWGSYGVDPPGTDSFTITYFVDSGGVPGSIIGGPFRQTNGTLTVTGPIDTCQTTDFDDPNPLYEYTAAHAAVSVAQNGCYWIEIANTVSGALAWYWASGGGGDLRALQDGPPSNGYSLGDSISADMAFCLNVQLGDPLDCLVEKGRCCINLGNGCVDCVGPILQSECSSLGGAWQAGVACSPGCGQSTCGACCAADGTCSIQTQANCASGMTYLGNNTDCDPNLCPGASGACCLANGNCQSLTAAACTAQGGSPQGAGVTCTSILCGDTCQSARLITCHSRTTINNAAAQTESDGLPFSCAFGGPHPAVGSIWFKFVATADSALISTLNTTPSVTNDSILSVYNASNPSSPCNSLVEIACSEDVGLSDASIGFLSRACARGLQIGKTYYVKFGTFNDASRGAYVLDIECPCNCCPGDVNTDCGLNGADVAGFTAALLTPPTPANPSFCRADLNLDGTVNTADIPLFAQALLAGRPCNDLCDCPRNLLCNGTRVVNNSQATRSEDDPLLTCANGGPDQGNQSVWFAFTAAATSVYINTCNTRNSGPGLGGVSDTILAVYDGDCMSKVQVACAEDSGCGYNGWLSNVCASGLTIGRRYLVEVASFADGGNAGEITVEMTCSCPP